MLVVSLYSSASSSMVNGLIGHSMHKQRRKPAHFCHRSDINVYLDKLRTGWGRVRRPQLKLFICAIQWLENGGAFTQNRKTLHFWNKERVFPQLGPLPPLESVGVITSVHVFSWAHEQKVQYVMYKCNYLTIGLIPKGFTMYCAHHLTMQGANTGEDLGSLSSWASSR